MKEIYVDKSEIVESDPQINRVRLSDGRIVSSSRIRFVAETAVQPQFEGIVPYAGTESAQDKSKNIETPSQYWQDMPA
jgi:hypothetical protein